MTYGSYAAFGHRTLQGFRRMKLGAGGQVLHMSISNDGVTRVIGTDAGGASIWNSGTSQWDQMITKTRMPSGDFGEETILGGCWAMGVAPSDSTRIYMLTGAGTLAGFNQGQFFGTMYVSANSGGTFTRAAGWTTINDMSPNDFSNKYFGPKLAVDPVNPDVCITTSPSSGAFRTTNGGTTFTAPTGLPTTTGTPHKGIAFDPTSASGGSSQVVYAHSHGNGVYKSTNGGSSFSLVTGGPTTCQHAKCGIDGAYYVLSMAPTAKFWRLVGSTWTDITPTVSFQANGQGTLCPSLTAAGTMYLSDDGGAMFFATNVNTSATPNWSARTDTSRTATDIPWLSQANETYMTNGDWVMDPVVPDKIWFCEGIGVWVTTAPQTTAPSLTPWISASAGIEELVTNQVISPPGGYPLVVNWDRAVFTIVDPESYPTDHGPNHAVAINLGSSVAWATTDPTFVVVQANTGAEASSYSTTKGTIGSWTGFSNTPPSFANGHVGGCIAASSTNTIVWEESDGGDIWYTRDRGATSWVHATSSNWGNNVADAASFTITAMADNGSGKIRCTVAAGLGTLANGQDIHFNEVVGTRPGFGDTLFGTYTAANVNLVSKTFDLDSTGSGSPNTPTGTFTSGSCIVLTGWHGSHSHYRQNVVADRVTADTFYLFNNGSLNNTATPGFGGGFFKLDFPSGTPTFTRQSFPAAIMGTPTFFHIHMESVIGNAGHVFFTTGEGQSTNTGLQHTENGCVTWQKTPNIGQVMCMSLGAIKAGNDYPSVYVVGDITGGGGFGANSYGIYRSDSSKATWAANTPTWTFIEDFPLDCVSQIKSIAGDPDVYGKFYLGTPCGGCYYYIP